MMRVAGFLPLIALLGRREREVLPETEIGKSPPETGARNPPRKSRNARNCGENKCPLVDRSGVSADQSPKGALRTGLCLQSNRSLPHRNGNWKMAPRDR